jgi:hypothetical protein
MTDVPKILPVLVIFVVMPRRMFLLGMELAAGFIRHYFIRHFPEYYGGK